MWLNTKCTQFTRNTTFYIYLQCEESRAQHANTDFNEIVAYIKRETETEKQRDRENERGKEKETKRLYTIWCIDQTEH